MATPLPPFTVQHAADVRAALAHVAEAKALMEKAKKCGAACDQDQVLADMLQQALEAYRDNFTEPQPAASAAT